MKSGNCYQHANHRRCALVWLVSFGVLWTGTTDAGDGDWSVSGFMRAQTAFSTGNDNPNNAALGLQSDPDLHLAKFLGVLDTRYAKQFGEGNAIDSLSFFVRTRVNVDGTENLSSGISKYDAFPAKYDDDWTLLRAKGDDAVAEIWEAFADISVGNAWFRLGRQNIVWGEADAIRLLDIVNALDLTQHLFIEGGGEQFDHIRIPVWALRGTYRFDFAPKFSIDAFVIPGDFVPTSLPGRGSPYNLLPFPDNAPPQFFGGPPFFIPGLRVEDDTNKRRGDLESGIRMLGQIGDVNFSLNYLNKIDQDGVIIFDRFDVPELQVVLRNHRDRLDIFGASFNAFWQGAGAVIRGEMTYTPDQSYADLPGAQIVEADTTKFVLGFDRPTFVFSKDRALTISLQWFETNRDVGRNKISILGAPGDEHETNFSLYLSQPMRNDQMFVEFLGVYDTDGAYWLQPQLRLAPGNEWRVSLYGNFFGGSEERPGRFGSLDFADEINLSVTYQF